MLKTGSPDTTVGAAAGAWNFRAGSLTVMLRLFPFTAAVSTALPPICSLPEAPLRAAWAGSVLQVNAPPLLSVKFKPIRLIRSCGFKTTAAEPSTPSSMPSNVRSTG
ncbi:hypothetical protein D3C75_1020020 [compost metagenome]